MRKKIFLPVFCLAVSVSLVMPATLAKASNENGDSVIVEKEQYIDEFGDTVNVTRYLDSNGEVIQGTVEKGMIPESEGEFTINAAPYWSASSSISRVWEKWSGSPQVRIYGNGRSASYTSSSKKTYKAINTIGVKNTLFFGSVVEHSSSKTNNNASTAAASSKQQSFKIPTARWKSQSNHTFKHTGYKSWYPTTTYTDKL